MPWSQSCSWNKLCKSASLSLLLNPQCPRKTMNSIQTLHFAPLCKPLPHILKPLNHSEPSAITHSLRGMTNPQVSCFPEQCPPGGGGNYQEGSTAGLMSLPLQCVKPLRAWAVSAQIKTTLPAHSQTQDRTSVF